jgi:2-phosphoglycolate phosphatase
MTDAMKKLIIYDLDGTLVDTRRDIANAANYMLAQMGAPPLNDTVIAGFVGRGLHRLVASCLKTEDPKKIEKGAKIYREYYKEHMLDYTRLYPGAKETLEYFKNKRQAVITNKPNPFSEEILKALRVKDYFVEIIAGDADFPKKPDPTAVLTILKNEKVKPEEALFIGDSVVDIETGRNARILTLVMTHGFDSEEVLKSAAPDVLVRNFKELLALARKEGW